jgi:hypothetical protein
MIFTGVAVCDSCWWQAVTAGAGGSGDGAGNNAMQQMLKSELPWWNALRNPSNNAWLQLFLASAEFRRWHDDSHSQ